MFTKECRRLAAGGLPLGCCWRAVRRREWHREWNGLGAGESAAAGRQTALGMDWFLAKHTAEMYQLLSPGSGDFEQLSFIYYMYIQCWI